MTEMNPKLFQWFLDHIPKPVRECPYYRTSLLVQEFMGYGPKTCAEDYEQGTDHRPTT